MIRTLIVDDEAPARRKLLRPLAAAPDFAVVGEAEDGVAAVEAIHRLAPDLVFLDIRMPRLDGFGVVEQVGAEAMPRVVFVTAYDEYAVRAFEVQALDYLLKPVAPSRFQAMLERVRRQSPSDARAERLAALLAAGVGGTRPRHLERLLVDRQGSGVLLRVDEIDRVEAARNFVVIHARGTTFVHRCALGALAARLDPKRFLRVSRSDLVRLDAIRELQPWSHGDARLVLTDGTELMWSRRFRSRQRADFELG